MPRSALLSIRAEMLAEKQLASTRAAGPARYVPRIIPGPLFLAREKAQAPHLAGRLAGPLRGLLRGRRCHHLLDHANHLRAPATEPLPIEPLDEHLQGNFPWRAPVIVMPRGCCSGSSQARAPSQSGHETADAASLHQPMPANPVKVKTVPTPSLAPPMCFGTFHRITPRTPPIPAPSHAAALPL